ncbi:MAG: glutaredoxin 3 [Pseudomonadota bacterium]
MAKIVMYTKSYCSYCDRAKALLNNKQLAYTEIRVDLDSAKLSEMIKLSGRRSVPQIFINNQAIGGFDDLALLAKSGELDQLLA